MYELEPTVLYVDCDFTMTTLNDCQIQFEQSNAD